MHVLKYLCASSKFFMQLCVCFGQLATCGRVNFVINRIVPFGLTSAAVNYCAQLQLDYQFWSVS